MQSQKFEDEGVTGHKIRAQNSSRCVLSVQFKMYSTPQRMPKILSPGHRIGKVAGREVFLGLGIFAEASRTSLNTRSQQAKGHNVLYMEGHVQYIGLICSLI